MDTVLRAQITRSVLRSARGRRRCSGQRVLLWFAVLGWCLVWGRPVPAASLFGVPEGEVWMVPRSEQGEVMLWNDPEENGHDPLAVAARYPTETDALLIVARRSGWLRVRLFSPGSPENGVEGWVRENEAEPLFSFLEQAEAVLPEPRVYFKGELDPATTGVTVTEHLAPSIAGVNRRLLICDARGAFVWSAQPVHPVHPAWGPGQFGELGDRSCSLIAVWDADSDGRAEFLAARPEPEGSWVFCDILRWNGSGFDTVMEGRALVRLKGVDAANVFLFRGKEELPDNSAGLSTVCAWEGLSGSDELVAAVEEEREDAVYRGRAVFRLLNDLSGATLLRWLERPQPQF